MKHSVGLASVLAAVLFLALSVPALSIEPPDPGEIEGYREDGSLEERIKFAKSLRNYQVHPSLIERKIARIRALQEGRPFIPQTFPYSTGLPSHGTPRVLAILIDFPDYSHTNDESIFINKLFGSGDSGEFPYESLTEFYQRSSYDALFIQGNVLGWYTAQYNRDHYGYGSWPYPGVKELIKEAMDYYNPTHDFSQYDNNNDGIIDYFSIFWAGPDTGWSSLWWGWCDITGYMFRWDPYAVDGKQLGVFSWQWEGKPVGSEFAPKTVIHETGHALGLPDYYDYDASVGPGGGVGGLDMMDSYGDHNAFSKWLLDWVTPTVVGDWGEAGTLTLRASSSYPDCVTIMPGQTGSDYFAEYFMVQNRSRLGNDQNIPADGLLAWHVDARLNSGGTNFEYDNSYTEHKLLRLMEADGLEEIETGNGRADAGDFYVQGNVFSPSSTPNSNDYAGGSSGVTVQNISAASSTMTADFSIISAGNQPPNTPLAPTGPDTGNPGTPHYFATATYDPDGDQVCYKFDWGDGNESDWTDFVDSGSAAGEYHSWSSKGIYEVKVKAKDINNAESGWSEAHTIVINNPPNTPPTPTGPDSGTPGTSYDFTGTTTDPNGDQVAFKFDWGDGSQSNWSSYVNSGSSVTKSHSWSTDGTYYLKAKAKDTYNAESAWSAGHPITIRAIVLEVDPSSLDFGDLGESSSKTMAFRAYNLAGGTLSGTISDNRDWITVSPASFVGNDNTISVTVDTNGLTESLTPYTGTVTVTSNGGTKTIEIFVTVIPTGVVVHPNPFSLSTHNNLTFWGTSVPYGKIQILTLIGELIRTLHEEYGISSLSWDLTNERGAKLVRGIYIYIAKDSTGKIAIIK